MSPHIDLHRGGPAFAWAYDRIVTESDAEMFVILGTAHTPLEGLFSVSRKHFETPLGIAQTDRAFVNDLATRLGARGNSSEVAQIFSDEMPLTRTSCSACAWAMSIRSNSRHSSWNMCWVAAESILSCQSWWGRFTRS